MDFLPGVFQEIPQNLVGHALGGEHVAVGFDVEPDFPGPRKDAVFDGFARDGVLGGVGDG